MMTFTADKSQSSSADNIDSIDPEIVRWTISKSSFIRGEQAHSRNTSDENITHDLF